MDFYFLQSVQLNFTIDLNFISLKDVKNKVDCPIV